MQGFFSYFLCGGKCFLVEMIIEYRYDRAFEGCCEVEKNEEFWIYFMLTAVRQAFYVPKYKYSLLISLNHIHDCL